MTEKKPNVEAAVRTVGRVAGGDTPRIRLRICLTPTVSMGSRVAHELHVADVLRGPHLDKWRDHILSGGVILRAEWSLTPT